jgi:hypothetical protein
METPVKKQEGEDEVVDREEELAPAPKLCFDVYNPPPSAVQSSAAPFTPETQTAKRARAAKVSVFPLFLVRDIVYKKRYITVRCCFWSALQ